MLINEWLCTMGLIKDAILNIRIYHLLVYIYIVSRVFANDPGDNQYTIRSSKLFEETQKGKNGYHFYERTTLYGIFQTFVFSQVENSWWLVSYNPLSTKTFNTHINVEFCNFIK